MVLCCVFKGKETENDAAKGEDIQARYDKVIARLEGEVEQAQSDYKRMSDELTEAQAVERLPCTPLCDPKELRI